MNTIKNKIILLPVMILLLLVSCQSLINRSITTTTVNPVPRAALLTLESEDYEVYTDGLFITKEGWNKVEINIIRLQKECDLLRAELSKFPSTEK